jgi:hypothetical protein
VSYNIKRLSELFKCIHAHTTDIVKDMDKYHKLKILGGAGTKIQFTNKRGTFILEVPEEAGKTLRIFDEGVEAIDLFTEELQKDDEIKTYVSLSGIEKQIDDVLRHNYGTINLDDLEQFVKNSIIKPIRSKILTWEVYIPLVNLKIEKELTLGDVSFVTKDIASKAVNDFREKGDYRFHGKTEEEKENNKKAFLGEISKAMKDYQAFAKVECKSHVSNIETIATNKAFIAINSIRSFLHVLYQYSFKALWGLPQEITSGYSGIISLDLNEHSLNMNYVANGKLLSFDLNTVNVEKLKKFCHLEIIQNILNKSETERNNLEKIIIDALQAIGKAVVAPTVDIRFIGYIMAIERLLIKDGEESSTERFTDRLVLALSDNQETRLQLARRAKELYNKRSKMVHAASFFNIYEEDEIDTENLAINLVIMAIGKCEKGYTHNQLCDEIDRKKYSGK